MCHECVIREQRIVLSPRTGLNGGERGQEQVREANKQRRRLKIRPRTNLNGGDLVGSTFLVLTFAFALAFMATFVLALILAFLSPFRARILTFLWCNGIRVYHGEQFLKGSGSIVRVGEVVSGQIFVRLCILLQDMRGGRFMEVWSRRPSA